MAKKKPPLLHPHRLPLLHPHRLLTLLHPHLLLMQPLHPPHLLLHLLAQREDVVAFCILGGVFGEGIDLPGKSLRSVVVVGTGMPQVNRNTRQLQAWYEERYAAGFEYAFLYPGMQKVGQALGRVKAWMP